jgi:hypothetical protein
MEAPVVLVVGDAQGDTVLVRDRHVALAASSIGRPHSAGAPTWTAASSALSGASGSSASSSGRNCQMSPSSSIAV